MVKADMWDGPLRGKQASAVRPPTATAVVEGRLRHENPFPADGRGLPFADASAAPSRWPTTPGAVLIASTHPGSGIERLALGLLTARSKPAYTLTC